MASVFHWSLSAALVLLYAYVIGTLLWLILVAPGLYRRQRDLLRRVKQLEQRVARNEPTARTT